MKRQEFLREFEDMAGLENGILQEDCSLKSISAWDSMTALMFISFVEEHLGVVVEGNQIASANNVNDLLNLISNKLEN